MTIAAVPTSEPDLYGQCHPAETPELIASALPEFRAAVGRICDAAKPALVQARQRCPELLTDDFQLLFLRCEVYNAELAAKRYARYWEKRLEVFGPDHAFRPLTLDQALERDRVALELGVVQLVPGRVDPGSGRSLVFVDPSKQDRTKYARESLCRALWYVLHAALLENVESQKKGVIVLGYPHHAKLSQIDRKLLKLNGESLRECIPVRLTALHLCHPPVFFAVVFPLFKIFLGERLRKRLKLHAGTEEHVLQTLAEPYGLTRDVIPSDLGGDVALDARSWLDARLARGM